MIKSLNQAERGMQMEQTRINALANNLANVNSAGFKQVLIQATQKGGGAEPVPGTEMALNASSRESGATRTTGGQTLLSHAIDMRGGPVQATGRETDVAIMGRGFFAVQTEEGERYTRAGSFLLDAERRLVTPEGHAVLGERGAVTLDGDSFSIENDGTVIVDGTIQGRLRLVDFPDTSGLEHQGGNLLLARDDIEVQDLAAEEIVVAQGHVEGSNVNPIDTLVALISAQRAFEVQSKVMTTGDQMLDKSVNSLGRAGR